MIFNCPFCGVDQAKPLKNGLALCNHCNQIFESNLRNKMLSAAWSLRRYHWGLDKLIEKYGNENHECEFIFAMVVNECFTYDEILKAFEEMKIDDNIKFLPLTTDHKEPAQE